MSFIQDFLEYNSGTECPINYLRWSALVALGVAASKKYFLVQGPNIVYPTMAVALIGLQGNRKSYAKDRAREIVELALPDYPLAAAIQSRENIVKVMAQDDAVRTFKNWEGISTPFTPLAFFINELKNFLSFNPTGMIDFITDIWDRPVYRSGTIIRGAEDIVLPCLNFLVCETPGWIIDRLKQQIISGGFARRFIFVNEIGYGDKPVPEPYLPPNHRELQKRMMDHLVRVSTGAGKYSWEPGAKKSFDAWYIRNFTELVNADPMLQGFLKSKDQQLIKVMILLDLDREKSQYLLTSDLLEEGLAFFDVIEPKIPRLFAAAGRNDLAAPTQKILDMLEANGGWLPEKKLRVDIEKDLSGFELDNVFRALDQTDRAVRKNVKFPSGVERSMVMTKEKFAEWSRTEAIKTQEKK